MEALPEWTRLVASFLKATDREALTEDHEGVWHHTGGGIFVGLVPVGENHLAIVSAEELTLWATGQGGVSDRYAVAYEQASGYEPLVGLRSDGTLYGLPSTGDNWWRCSADSVSAGMLVDLGDEAGRDGEPREVLTTQPIGNEIYLEFNDDDPGAKFSYDERVWVRDKALESTE